MIQPNVEDFDLVIVIFAQGVFQLLHGLLPRAFPLRVLIGAAAFFFAAHLQDMETELALDWPDQSANIRRFNGLAEFRHVVADVGFAQLAAARAAAGIVSKWRAPALRKTRLAFSASALHGCCLIVDQDMPNIGVKQLPSSSGTRASASCGFQRISLEEGINCFSGDADAIEISAVVAFVLLEVFAHFVGAERRLNDRRLRRNFRFVSSSLRRSVVAGSGVAVGSGVFVGVGETKGVGVIVGSGVAVGSTPISATCRGIKAEKSSTAWRTCIIIDADIARGGFLREQPVIDHVVHDAQPELVRHVHFADPGLVGLLLRQLLKINAGGLESG